MNSERNKPKCFLKVSKEANNQTGRGPPVGKRHAGVKATSRQPAHCRLHEGRHLTDRQRKAGRQTEIRNISNRIWELTYELQILSLGWGRWAKELSFGDTEYQKRIPQDLAPR